MISDKFVILGALFNLYGTFSYTIATLKGRTKPNRVSWFMWALAPLIAFAAEINKGVGLQSLMTFMVGFGPLVVFSVSFLNKKSIWKLGKFDFICGGLSLLGLVLWLTTREGDVAIALSIVADALAALPTLVKSYTTPESENSVAFSASAISAGITLLTIDKWTFANYGFPVYIFLICVLLTVLIRFKVGLKLAKVSIG
jgi:energy-converting hydrogenase Eha subunit A